MKFAIQEIIISRILRKFCSASVVNSKYLWNLNSKNWYGHQLVIGEKIKLMKELEHFIEEPLSDFIETLDDVAQLDQ